MKLFEKKKKEEIIEENEKNVDFESSEEDAEILDESQTDEDNMSVPKQKLTVKERVKKALFYSIHTWIFKCFVIAFGMELVVETLGRRSLFKGIGFMISSPVVYLYNVSIIFFTLLFALFLRKRVFGLIMISMLWFTCGIVNFVVLGYRVTPFAAIDFLMLFDVFSMIDVYLRKWQQILIVIAIVGALILLVILFKKTPKFEGHRHVKRTMLTCVGVWIFVLLFTNFSVKHNIISDDFANLGEAYKDYGFAYCFTNSIIDNGIDEPEDYSKETVLELKAELDTVVSEGEKKTPNVIIIQLESFFDPKDVVGLNMSEDPVPTFTKLKEEYPSGYFTVPALGAGTANTEFEVITGMSSGYFGAGEYAYKTTVNDTPVESLCSILKKEGYGTYAIHNNKSSFYDRKDVYDTMGFDAFISLEYMYDVEYTYNGWAKDFTLVDDIMKCMKDTKGQDFVYTISVQAHGRYPEKMDEWEDYIQVDYEDESLVPAYDYYINQIHEMDMMIEDLIEELDAYGEDYVLLLYGDHLPTLELTEENLPNSSLFQTEYILVNNIGLDMEDEDIVATEISTKILSALNIPYGYAQKAQIYYEDPAVVEEKIHMIAYDMLFGERYLYDGGSPVPEDDMKMGVDVISISSIKNKSDHIVVTGENFNEFSVVYDGDKDLDTIYVDSNTLMVEDRKASSGDVFTVKQVDKSHHILSTSEKYVY
ncbi:MAG: LTA synthase family protein [Lachnospiraceae bacterium]|nr:LTA synthase family protein [Lachnospiraceae bacterium]